MTLGAFFNIAVPVVKPSVPDTAIRAAVMLVLCPMTMFLAKGDTAVFYTVDTDRRYFTTVRFKHIPPAYFTYSFFHFDLLIR